MRRIVAFAMLATMFGSLLVAAPTVSAGTTILPFQCDQEIIDSLVADGYELQYVAELGEDNVGGPESQLIIGTSGDDVIDGGAGNDHICGALGADTIEGGSGHDALYGNRGSDTVDGQSGNDNVQGNNDSSDNVFGGTGNDFVQGGGGGNDVCTGNSGHDEFGLCETVND